MNRCVIIGGADIKEYDEIKSYLKEDDFNIFCDSGLKHQEKLGIRPDLIIGDFDSFVNPHLDVETIVLPRAKDDTDTAYAAGEAIKRGYRDILLIGAAGGREDHTLVNLFLLFRFDTYGIRARLVDDYSEMEVVSGKPAYIDDSYPYFSLVNMTGTARGISIKNAKFPLQDAEIISDNQYCTSNEVLPGQTAEVAVKEGRVLLIKVRRDSQLNRQERTNE